MSNASLALEWWWVLLLLPLPLLIRRLLPPLAEESPAIKVPFYEQITELSANDSLITQGKPLAQLLLGLIWLLLLLSLSRPTLIGEAVPQETEARDLFLAVDISGSMEERDMTLNNRPVQRIDLVKSVLGDFISQREGDRLGLILFADNAYVQAPLTYDTTTINLLLQQSQLGFAGQKTAIGDAIGLAVKQLAERPSEARTLILLTDGASNAGNVEPLEAASIAAENGIRIYTVGIGGGQQAFRGLFSSSIIPPKARDIDDSTLQRIADLTGGMYFRADNSQELAQIYTELDQLEPVEQDEQLYRPRKPLFYWPMGIATGILTLWVSTTLAASVFNRKEAA